MTLMIGIGKSGGFYTSFSKSSWRICLWCIAFTIFWFDLDLVIQDMAEAYLEKQAKPLEGKDET